MLIKICRPIAIAAAAVSLIFNACAGNWIGVAINAATIVALV